MRRSHTAILERGEALRGDFATEPYEAGWASEALVFLRLLAAQPTGTNEPAPPAAVSARVQISPDGMHWVDEGTTLPPDGDVRFARVREFGNWLRVAGTVSPPGAEVRALVYLVLKE
ncbi:MAG: hypothetical protein HY332_15365 [Chloroflexi bacterium]|nr:hypothetical protein [Chloroflexota bacterium]